MEALGSTPVGELGFSFPDYTCVTDSKIHISKCTYSFEYKADHQLAVFKSQGYLPRRIWETARTKKYMATFTKDILPSYL